MRSYIITTITIRNRAYWLFTKSQKTAKTKILSDLGFLYLALSHIMVDKLRFNGEAGETSASGGKPFEKGLSENFQKRVKFHQFSTTK